MSDISFFTDKNRIPAEQDLRLALGNTFDLWVEIRDYVHRQYPAAIDEWNYPGAKYGWSFRIRDKKRAIIYLLPRDGFFKTAFVFGQKAFGQIMDSRISKLIKDELESARVYAEGRGIRIDVRDEVILGDIRKLIDIKLAC